MKTCLKCGKTYPDDWTFCPDDNTPLVDRPVQTQQTGSPTAGDPVVGKVLAGRYRVTDKIAQGGMGAVYRAIHTRMNRVCALKLLAQATPDEQSVARFNREAQMASRIDNPHAVTIYDFGEAEGGALYLAMEYVDGEPLSAAIAREGHLDIQRVNKITAQIADALAAAHRLGIIHRDLKPDNVMLTQKGGERDYVKVLDFGIAKAVSGGMANENLTQTGFVLGTPLYMSPEQLTGETLDVRSDIYSLALIVYQMASGQLPFTGQSTQKIMMKRITDEPIKLRECAPFVGKEVETVIMRALSRDRELRQRSVEQLAAELASAIGSAGAVDAAGTVSMGSVSGSGPEYEGPTVGRGATTPSVPPSETEENRSETELATAPLADRGTTSAQHAGTEGYAPPSAYVTNASPQTPPVQPTETIAGGQPLPTPPTRQAQVLPNTQQPGPSPPPSGSAPGPVVPETRQAFQQPGPTPNQPPPSQFPGGQQPQYQYGTPSQSGQPGQMPSSRTPTLAEGIGPGSGLPASSAEAVFPASQGRGGQTRTSKGPVVALIIVAVVVVGALGVGGYFFYSKTSSRSRNASSNKSPRTAPNTPASTSPPSAAYTPSPAGPAEPRTMNPAAVERFDSGKVHQEQGASFDRNGSKDNAAEEYKKAISEYRSAVALQPDYPEAHENLAVALYDTDDPGSAVGEYKTAIDQYIRRDGKATEQVMANYGLALFDLGRYEDAAQAFGRAIEIDPSDHDLYAHRGFALQNAGRDEEAKSEYQRYLSLEPSGQYADGVRAILAGKMKPPTKSGNE